jgi:hypothetical protein
VNAPESVPEPASLPGGPPGEIGLVPHAAEAAAIVAKLSLS